MSINKREKRPSLAKCFKASLKVLPSTKVSCLFGLAFRYTVYICVLIDIEYLEQYRSLYIFSSTGVDVEYY